MCTYYDNECSLTLGLCRERESGSLRQYLQIYSGGGGYEQAVVAHELELCVSESNLWM